MQNQTPLVGPRRHVPTFIQLLFCVHESEMRSRTPKVLAICISSTGIGVLGGGHRVTRLESRIVVLGGSIPTGHTWNGNRLIRHSTVRLVSRPVGGVGGLSDGSLGAVGGGWLHHTAITTWKEW